MNVKFIFLTLCRQNSIPGANFRIPGPDLIFGLTDVIGGRKNANGGVQKSS
jgi:hypothetical protein